MSVMFTMFCSGDVRCLNPDNEVRRLFGSRVVQADQRFVITEVF